jgi:hypothetical protein
VKRMLAALWSFLSSRALSPLVIGFFLLLYIGIAFFTDETLTVLIALTGKSLILGAILSLLPLNIAARIWVEARRFLKMRRALSGAGSLEPGLYDETVELAAVPALAELEGRLAAEGYATRLSGDSLAAWRGVSLSPARLLLLAGTFCLFAGIFVSLESRSVQRQAVIEGKPYPSASGLGGMVERIVFRKSSGPILGKELVVEVATAGQGGGVKKFVIYPPTMFEGAFAYPRYLGVALNYSFLAPDLPGGYTNSGVFPMYPPGRESMLIIPQSPYKVAVSLAKPEDGSDPYMTGQLVFRFKLMKGADVLFADNLPTGGEFVRDGVRLAFTDARRMVVTDFVVDYGVLLIWCAGGLLLLAAVVWLPVRLLFPRREMLFSCEANRTRASSHAEGARRRHAGAFHEVLDFLAARQSGHAPTP